MERGHAALLDQHSRGIFTMFEESGAGGGGRDMDSGTDDEGPVELWSCLRARLQFVWQGVILSG
jgi:hypothetical protein